MMGYRNLSWYSDPTAGIAMAHIRQEEKRRRRRRRRLNNGRTGAGGTAERIVRREPTEGEAQVSAILKKLEEEAL